MEILNLGGSFEPSARSPKKKFKVVLGIGLLAAVMGMGSTLAASITLNSGSAVEFGQGIASTTACDTAITLTPFSTYVNNAVAADFLFTSFALSDVDTSTAKCGGKTFVIKGYTDSSTVATNYSSGESVANPLYLGWHYTSGATGGAGSGRTPIGYNTGIALTLNAGGTSCTVTVLAGAGSADISGAACALTANTLTVTLGDGGGGAAYGPASSAVTKLTVESMSSAPSGYASTTVS